ncbi:hypothetical protein ACFQUX_21790 [Pantoea stewartii]
MANTHYLFWVMFGALTLLFIVIATFVGMSRTAKHGFYACRPDGDTGCGCALHQPVTITGGLARQTD